MEDENIYESLPELVETDAQPGKSISYDIVDVPELGVKVVKIEGRLFMLKGKMLLPLDGRRGIKIEEDTITLSWGS
ncbi:MAG: hypothetical protein LCH52_05580 [Bacteroidetes bacterium]|nr:hypothetical protein [Bacteroidota bacterium]